MRNIKINWLRFMLPALAGLPAAPAVYAVSAPVADSQRGISPVDWLLLQVRMGETSHQLELVKQSLYRLENIAPDNPDVLAALLRHALMQSDRTKAQRYMDRLNAEAPNSPAAQEATVSMMLSTAEGRQQWQEARLLAASGRLVEARAAYDALFHGVYPTVDIAYEYWRLAARIPGQEPLALKQLQALDRQYPGSVSVRMQIARMLFSQDDARQAITTLRALADNARGRDDAAELWLKYIKAQPITGDSVAQLHEYLTTFTTGDEYQNGRQELDRQQELLADPVFQQRAASLARVARGEGATAIPALQKALRANPNDADVLGAMGQALARSNQRAAAVHYFEQAIQVDEASLKVAKWQSLLESTRYWLAVDCGDSALAAQDLDTAERQYRQARTLDNDGSDAVIGLGDVALARHHPLAAEQLYRQALQMDSNATAARRLVTLYQQESPQKAMAFIENGLTPAQKRALLATLNALRSDTLRADADRLAAQSRWTPAVEKYREAISFAPDDVWLHYRLATALRAAGQPEVADREMEAMSRQQPHDATHLYAYSLYLSGSDRAHRALALLNSVPEALREQSLQDLMTRLQHEDVYTRAYALHAAGRDAQAHALLHMLPDTPRRRVVQADWALEQGNTDAALTGYQQVLTRDPFNGDARIGQAEALTAQGRRQEAQTTLAALSTGPVEPSLDQGRRTANLWWRLGEPQRANSLYTQLKRRAAQTPPSPEGARIYRDAASLARQQGHPDEAREDYRQAMVDSGITPAPPSDNAAFTALTRLRPEDSWLQRSIRADAASLYRQQDTTLSVAQDYSRNKGTGGQSDFTAHTTMLQGETPIADGRGFLRVDHVAVSAGQFSAANGTHTSLFGTCADSGCRRARTQRAEGVALGAGWRHQDWSVDMGTTPIGFRVLNWVGGISRKTDIHDVGVTFTASRRPISSSLLAFAGAQNPGGGNGNTWGGVVATGGAIGLSYDHGGDHGLWGDISAHRINGKNVAGNQRRRLMGGYYYKLINEDHRRATLGFNSMVWRYQKDLSGYTYGQGGYYSPQRYLSLAVPVTYRQRMDNWSLDLGGSVSWSRSKTAGQRRYPVYPGFDSDRASASGSSQGIGYTLQAQVERRLTEHWTLGLSVDIQKAKDYTPSHAVLYLRYSGAGWQGDMDMPILPMTPYADVK
ncbi:MULTISPECIES: cellulose synthase complex outer membrane protein BcsC [Lonsdalea]|uniref:Cellulose biosynthesis protein BcsC n=2 Tax=Lonsdalea TaxID=1082702 RepID=A0ACD1JCP5_9GAMM|nr:MULTISPECIES: cellulose synthase complex outer membrane protein BcsC [Lonsdalea]OSN02095.1 cellulose biosynthesis protein BcsC [Lonsdalea populi]QPQ23164.1 cellulose biosynthesis protein BcsC [Lonsdalea populi]RAT13350.1 cellulose biosynthesis protein BcsC [Lonsdalea quercina]RAT14233.1 cellulose biosynthesis protein BcsC [Lonsdalea quercina]RAT21650.1 cellulose biosynthesis protein BcsC [Lonsdalea populi]